MWCELWRHSSASGAQAGAGRCRGLRHPARRHGTHARWPGRGWRWRHGSARSTPGWRGSRGRAQCDRSPAAPLVAVLTVWLGSMGLSGAWLRKVAGSAEEPALPEVLVELGAAADPLAEERAAVLSAQPGPRPVVDEPGDRLATTATYDRHRESHLHDDRDDAPAPVVAVIVALIGRGVAARPSAAREPPGASGGW
jgi:hypothetical protein